ncbi:serine--tRNA ligase [Candidatus Uhrbacteria bacterium]|nr:serine--tRNA ligase [Candidatus Uhrbacteria bacterium]
MLDCKLIREQPDVVAAALRSKGVVIDLTRILALDVERRELQGRVEAVAAEKRASSARIANAAGAERMQLLEALKDVDQRGDVDAERLKQVDQELQGLLWQLPNIPLPDVKMGRDDSENEIIRSVGLLPQFPFPPRASWELGPSLGMFDTERAGKVSGSRFGYLLGHGALLEFALLRYALRTLTAAACTPVVPPVLIGSAAMDAMGYTLHGGKEETYYLDRDDLYLVGTSEQSIGPMHMGEIFTEAELPKRYMGFSTCFRREAGTYGKDTKGIFRVHQFDKIEMFSFTTAAAADAEHERLLALEEQLLQGLGLPYQVVKMCTGDLGVPAARKYDLEAWFPSERRYRELTSTSTCTDWQARRLRIRYRPADGGSLQFVHTLNGTAFAIGRTICAILEHYQQADGSVIVPEVLRTDVGSDCILPTGSNRT